MKSSYSARFILLFFVFFCNAQEKSPRLTVVLVIDQFAYHELQKLLPFFKGGIKFLHDNGIRYINAFHAHGMPETGIGHTTIGTATWAKDHGIIGNSWINEKGNLVLCDQDNSPHAAVFSPDGTYNFGVSPKNIMVDALSDQLRLNSFPHAKNTIFSISLKSRSSVGMAGRLGNALWFDTKTGNFTSSKAYFKELPAWVKIFNKERNIQNMKSYTWDLTYPKDDQAYQFYDLEDYEYTGVKRSWIGTHEINHNEKDPFLFFEKTPNANKLLLDFAHECLKTHITDNHNERFILWLSLSSLDLIGHVYGPNSLELIDMLYHVDNQLNKFIQSLSQYVPLQETLFVLTADHGVFPILETLKKRGIPFAHRMNADELIKVLNDGIEEKHGIKNAIAHFKMPCFYCSKEVCSSPRPRYNAIIEDIKKELMATPGIKAAWTYKELIQMPTLPRDLKQYYKNQLYHNRTGDIICQVQPYNYIDTYTSGTAHGTPYDYDTHVPLIVYQKGVHENKTIGTTVFTPQIGVTLAEILNVPRPSASTFDVLPGIITEKKLES